MSSEIINFLPNIENKSYLELGVNDNSNFSKIKSTNKFSVDINGKAMFTGTTDEYFEKHKEKFDIIFIDANHDYDYVLRDLNNSIDRCNEWILIHDLIPPSKKYIQSKFCSDGYKILQYILTEEKINVYPMNENYGLTLLKMPIKKIYPNEKYKSISYKEFTDFIETQKLYSRKEIINLLEKNNV